MEIRVATQQELDEALARPDLTYSDDEIIIDSPRGVWLEMTDSKGLSVRACNSSSVRAYGLSAVCACDSSRVWAREASRVWARDSSTVQASDSSSVDAYDSSIVWVDDFASVRLHSKDATAVFSDM